MKRMLLLMLLLPLLASCCVNKAAEKAPQCILRPLHIKVDKKYT